GQDRGHGRPRAHRNARCALAAGLPVPRRRELPQAHAREPRRRRLHGRLPPRGRHEVPAAGEEVLMETITFNIKRFDGERAWNQEYRLPRETSTLLGCLAKIREEQDPTLNFTSNCRAAICGSCAVQVNGSAFLACETQLDALLDTYQTTTLYLEPLNHFPVVRDLVVDFAPVEKGMRKVDAWLCPSKERRDHLQSEADFRKIAKPADCIDRKRDV